MTPPARTIGSSARAPSMAAARLARAFMFRSGRSVRLTGRAEETDRILHRRLVLGHRLRRAVEGARDLDQPAHFEDGIDIGSFEIALADAIVGEVLDRLR